MAKSVTSGFNSDDLAAFEQDLAKAAKALGSQRVMNMMAEAMKPIEEQAIMHVNRRTGTLQDSIKTRSRAFRGVVFKVTTGVHRRDWNKDDYYPAFVEYGHSGPKEGSESTPSSPFLRPAYEMHRDDAFNRVVSGISDLLKESGL